MKPLFTTSNPNQRNTLVFYLEEVYPGSICCQCDDSFFLAGILKKWSCCNILTLDRAVNQETGASGRRYRNITLTFGRDWIRCRCVRALEAGRRQTIIKPGATDGLDQLEFEAEFEPVWVRVPVAVRDWMPAEWEQAPDRGLGPSVTPVEQPSILRKKCCYGQRNLG